ncbi:MAG: NAD(P)H-binding protein [Myxococcota bacterium]|nr:NAD(P)H-binding protein [Myxococcota bacterium]
MPTSRPRRIFVAGSTGATGRTLVRLATGVDVDIVPHLRPRTAEGRTLHPQAAVLDLTDAPALDAALTGCTTVLQLIGTMRKRFADGDTYESSDIGTTRCLVESALRTGVDHLVLLSSVGAGKPRGAYLRAKATAEALVVDSGLDWTLVRPSAFDGEGHRPMPGLALLTGMLGLDRYRPIRIEQLAGALLHVASQGTARRQVLEGASLWEQVEAAGGSLHGTSSA